MSPIDQYQRLAREALMSHERFSLHMQTHGLALTDEFDRKEALAALTAAAEELVEQIIGEYEETVIRSDTPLKPPHVSTSLVVDHAAEARNALRQSQRKQVEEAE